MQIKFFKKTKKFKKKSMDATINALWQISLYGMLLLAVVSAGVGYYLFIKTGREPSLDGNNVVQVETVKKDRIDKVLQYFSERQKISDDILHNPAPVIDPSS